MKQYKVTIIAVIVLIVAIAAFLVVKNVVVKNDPTPTDSPDDYVDQTVTLCAFLPKNVTKITFHNEEELVVVRLSEDSWTCTSHPEIEVYDTAVQDILTIFGSLNGLLIMDGSKEQIDYGKFGLGEENDPKWTSVLLEDGTTYKVFLGVNNLSGSRTYAKVDGEDKVYSISSTYSDDLIATRADLIYLYPFKFADKTKVNSIKMYKKGEISFAATADFSGEEKTWVLSEPVKRGGERSNINTLVDSLTNIKISEIVESGCKDFAKYGLDNPDTRYVMSDSTGLVKTVSVGNKTSNEKMFYCVFNDGSDVYTVETGYFAYKDTNLLSFMDVNAFLETYTNLSHVDIYINDDEGESNYTMDIKITETTRTDENGNEIKDISGNPVVDQEEELRFNGNVVEGETQTDLFRKVTTSIYMIRLIALELDQGEVGKTLLKITYTRTDGSQVIVECRERDDTTMYIYVNDEYTGGYCKKSRISSQEIEYSIRNTTKNLLAEMGA